MTRPRLEVANIFREHAQAYLRKHGATTQQLRAIRDIIACRTEALGGHVDKCDTCDLQVISYNSCRNRHCPKCQALTKARWLQARQSELLPVEYYHVVFTIPDKELAPVAYQNKRLFYDLTFRLAAETLQTIAADPKHLGAHIGLLAILHTWGQTLTHHPHIHCVVPGGGLSADEKRWVACRHGFFLPAKVLAAYFRNHFLRALEKAFDKGRLEFHGSIERLADPDSFKQLIQKCRKKKWGVMVKKPFGGPDKVLDYLGRYTHRIAISNHRILSLRDGVVTFTYKDYKDDGARKTMSLPALEFIRRFLQHVLPRGFMRIRHYGLFANCHRAGKILLCRQFLGADEPPAIGEKQWPELFLALTGKDPTICPKCKRGRLVRKRTVAPAHAARIHVARAPP
jgi:hypothetical protein